MELKVAGGGQNAVKVEKHEGQRRENRKRG